MVTRMPEAFQELGYTNQFLVARQKESSKEPADVRRVALFLGARLMFEQIPPGSHIFCEEPLALKNGKTTRILNLACGAVWAAHVQCDITWWWADVSAWKREIIGIGNASKDDIRDWSMFHGGQEDWDEDHHDAHAIMAFGEMQLAQAGIELPAS